LRSIEVFVEWYVHVCKQTKVFTAATRAGGVTSQLKGRLRGCTGTMPRRPAMTETVRTSGAKGRLDKDAAKPAADATDGLKGGEALKDRAEAVRSWTETRAGVAKAWAAHRADKVRDLIAEEPVVAVGVGTLAAFAAGLLVGLVVGRLTAD
jgi:ElaB/YqjD/DUF883 family membrane-anchored ribosome-binding protein